MGDSIVMNGHMEIQKVSSKYEQLRYFAENGIPCPKVYGVLKLGELFEHNFPASLKLRSNHPVEMNGFEGIFESLDIGFRTNILEDYCAYKAVEPNDLLHGLEFAVQENIPYQALGSIYVHPHNPALFFIKCRFLPYQYAKNYSLEVDAIVREEEDQSFEVVHSCQGGLHFGKEAGSRFEFIQEHLVKIAAFYKKASSLPEFEKTGYSLEMEFGLGMGILEGIDIHALQMRNFKLKETASFILNREDFDPENCLITNHVFGITSGITLNYLEASRGNFGDRYTEILKATQGEDLMIKDPPLGITYVPLSVLGRIKAMFINSLGQFDQHTDFRVAKGTPYMLFGGTPSPTTFFNAEKALPEGTLTPYRLYSDGNTGIVQRIS